MRLSDILTEMPFGGSRDFGGTGQGIFQQRHYVYIAHALHDVPDEAAKTFLENWFVDIFNKDSFKFKEQLFRKAVANGIRPGNRPTFQSRHFYYLAHFVNEVTDPSARAFIMDWLGELIGSTNTNFIPERWRKFCGDQLTPEDEKRVNPRRNSRE
jgi:hypothetical protein